MQENIIPPIIHYCWFGRRPLSRSAKRCIRSWQRHFPGWEIRQHDESNFDIRSSVFSAEAVDAGQFVFANDYARLKILYDEGGIYFDLDVEVLRNFDDIICSGAFLGFEVDASNRDDFPGRDCGVNPGQGMGFSKGHPFLAKMLAEYEPAHFILDDGSYDTTTSVVRTTRLLRSYGLTDKSEIQHIDLNGDEICNSAQDTKLSIYPHDYFCPIDNDTARFSPTPNTHSVHLFEASWVKMSQLMRIRYQLRQKLLRLRLALWRLR